MELSPENARLRQALLAEAEKVSSSNAIRSAHLTALIEEYVASRDALAALSSETVSSYSVGGRSFSRRSLTELTDRLRDLTRDLAEALPAAAVLLPAPSAEFCGILFP